MHTVIVGGGFAGVKAALELAKKQVSNITLISDVPDFLHHATLYATATGKSRAESILPLAEIFAPYSNVTVVLDTVTSFDPHRNLVIGEKKQYSYDTLVLALGSVTTYFGIDGVAAHSYGIKSVSEIDAFTAHIRDEVVKDHQLDRNYFVIGAGPTGVELAGALNQCLRELKLVHKDLKGTPKVTVVEAAPRIIPRSSNTAAKIVGRRLKKLGISVLTNHKVEGLTGDSITIDGKNVPTKTAIWTSGVANNPFFTSHADHFKLSPNNHVIVDEYLRSHKNVYVIGDNNTVKYSGMAWPALAQGAFVADHIVRTITKRHTKAFRPSQPPSGLPVGDGWGYVEWHGIYVAGRTGAFVRRLMELYDYTQIVSYRRALLAWKAHDIPQVDR